MARRRKYKFSIEGKPLYPHLKLTRERFPRTLATRIIRSDDAEYFGAFLHRSNARILVDFLNRTFRLRSCEIEIDGSFDAPCTMYYKGRCLAPCVSELTDSFRYAEFVAAARLFLSDERGLFQTIIETKIDDASRSLDFERAAEWRDILEDVKEYWENARTVPWTTSVSDTFFVRHSGNTADVFLISQKARRTLGERVFTFTDVGAAQAGEILADVIEQFYRFHGPKEIRVSHEFVRRRELSNLLSDRFGRRIPIKLLTEKNRKISTEVAIYRSSTELDLARSVKQISPTALMKELKNVLGLRRAPRRISAIDTSHISGTGQVAAVVVWENGRTRPDAAKYLLTESTSETAGLVELVERLDLIDGNDLILIDGGTQQLNAVRSAMPPGSATVLVAAVKPPGKHSEISHFLIPDGRRVGFSPEFSSLLLLQRLRDDAHEFANAVHRETRDYAQYYELSAALPSLSEPERRKLVRHFGSRARVFNAGIDELSSVLGSKKGRKAAGEIDRYRKGLSPRAQPLVVPIRFQEENGAAEDLRPIEAAPGRPGLRRR